MSRISDVDFAAIRDGLKALPRISHHAPGAAIDLENIVVVPSHRAALDPDRALVVGNRGMGKSYWAHVLADPSARAYVATKFPELAALDVISGFNASERTHPITPNLNTFNDAFLKLNDTESLWRTILLRAAKDRGVDVRFSPDRRTSFHLCGLTAPDQEVIERMR